LASTRQVRTNQSIIVTEQSAIRILHLTDPHLFADKKGELRGVRTYASLKGVLAHYRGQDWRAELVVSTGDLVQDDSRNAYKRFVKLLSKLDLPVDCIPGNHDVRKLMRDMLSKAPFSYCPNRRIGNWLLASVDSCMTGRAGGHVADAEMASLDQVITDSDAEHIMVFMHHPPVAMGSAWLDTVGLDNGAEFLGRVQAHPRVRGIVFGHVHQEYDRKHDAIRVIATPSTCRQFKPRADTFAVDDNPPAYRQIELHPDGSMSTKLVWVPHD
jgi:Icc protein